MDVEMKDLIGRDLEVGQYVAYTKNPYAQLYIGKIFKLTPKGVKVERIPKPKWHPETVFKYPKEVVILEGYNE